MRDIDQIRADITATDRNMKELFLRRMSLAEEVADNKLARGDKILKPDREEALLVSLCQDLPDDLKQSFSSVLKATIRTSRTHQYQRILQKHPESFSLDIAQRTLSPKNVFYQGMPASYQYGAAKQLIPKANLNAAETFEQVFQKVSAKEADVGIVPVENSTAGAINEVYDLLIKYNLHISHSIIMRIQHCLAAAKGTAFSDINTVYSHPQALGQCQNFLAAHQFEAQAMSNTAVAAHFIAQGHNRCGAAICSEAAADFYGLVPLRLQINDGEYNQTRFIAVTRELTAADTDNRISLMFTLPHTTGSLSSALSIFSDYESNLTEIHSRPLAETPWTFRFYVDFTGNILHYPTRCLLYQLFEELPEVRLLGCYSVSHCDKE